MKPWWKRGILIVALLFIAFQFYQPEKNYQEPDQVIDTLDFVRSRKALPRRVVRTLETSCYNCHSNTTKYDWYDFIQPARFLVESHIEKGKKELNFNEWGSYTDRTKERLLRSMVEQIETGRMPLPSYLFLHKEAKLSPKEVDEMISWLKKQEP